MRGPKGGGKKIHRELWGVMRCSAPLTPAVERVRILKQLHLFIKYVFQAAQRSHARFTSTQEGCSGFQDRNKLIIIV